MCQNVLLLKGWKLFHCVCVVYIHIYTYISFNLFICPGTLGCSYLLAIAEFLLSEEMRTSLVISGSFTRGWQYNKLHDCVVQILDGTAAQSPQESHVDQSRRDLGHIHECGPEPLFDFDSQFYHLPIVTSGKSLNFFLLNCFIHKIGKITPTLWYVLWLPRIVTSGRNKWFNTCKALRTVPGTELAVTKLSLLLLEFWDGPWMRVRIWSLKRRRVAL